MVEGEGVGSGGNQADARRHLRREGADEDDDQQPEQRVVIVEYCQHGDTRGHEDR